MLHSKLLSWSWGLLAGVSLTTGAPALAQTDHARPNLTPTERSALEALVRDVQQKALTAGSQARQSPKTPASRRVDDIADARMAEERAKVLRFLKIDPDSEHALYIFVSWSMPLSVLRAYAIEAMWTGGTLVFRGLPPGRSMKDFFLKDLRQLVWDKGASAAISVDPRLFDAYQIEVVPAIALSSTRENLSCAGAGEHTLQAKGRTFRYSRCPPLREEQYLKMAGAVTLDYALETFEREGRPAARVYLEALRRGYPAGRQAPRTQGEFKGEWSDAFTPQRLMERSSVP